MRYLDARRPLMRPARLPMSWCPCGALIVLLFSTAAPASARAQAARPAPRTPAVSAQAMHFVDSLLAIMSLDEKLGQLTQVPGQGTPTGPKALPGGEAEIRAGHIGSFLGVYGAETTRQLQRVAVESSPHHIPLLFSHDVIHGFRTIFPVPLAEAASWDPDLVMRGARVAADEATAAGVHWTFAPMVDIARDPRWGRIVEGSGEDPYLGSLLAAARVHGFQGTDLAANNTLLATVKHFVAYGAAEGGRDYNVADLSPQTLHDVYLPPFQAAVDAGAWSVMASFNEVAGTPMHANRTLIDGLLRAQWGWDGVLVSDYTGVLELIAHGVAADSAAAARLAITSGVDVDMVSQFYRRALPEEMRNGRVSLATVDSAVRRVLLAKYSLGLFDDPFRYADPARERATLLSVANRRAAREMARESIVLLKNAPLASRPLLPLAKDARSIAVIGALAVDGKSANGNWWGDGRAEEAVTILDGIRGAVSKATRVTFAKGTEATGTDSSGFAAARRVARGADVVILVVGEREDQSAEAESRASIELSGMQEQLVRTVHAIGKPTIVVLMNGRPLAIPWIAEHVPAVVESWFLGSEMGNALADVLFGDVNPSGKLPVTMPRATGQVPLYYAHKRTGRPPRAEEKYTSKYNDVAWTPLFPFGYGLSYTTFQYSPLVLSTSTIGARDSISVSVQLRNTGNRAGVEVVQLYLQDEVGSLTRPVKELRGFQRVALGAGESRRVSFTLVPSDLAFHDADLALVAEPGAFRVYVGGSSEDVQEGRFQLQLTSGCTALEFPRDRARFTWSDGPPSGAARGLPGTCRGATR
ncbi:MAG: glycoside hydrolase family 3 N-terminal domain-containing protein [Gemmatimonadota bacterium]